jgi:ABC-type branched-subunit amino acid transport system permease subunit
VDRFLAYLEIGVSSGLVYGLLALGLVMVYKGSRVLNFAHPYFGLQAAFNCWWFTSHGVLFGRTIVPFKADSNGRVFVALLIALLLAGLNGYVIEHSIIRRLRQAPRLIVLVATIALAQGTVGGVTLLFTRDEGRRASASAAKHIPVILSGLHFTIGSRVVTGADIQILIAAPVLCIATALFFRYTKFGVAIRAAAENGEAARLLGISADRVSSFTWVAGSLLAAIAGILITQSRGVLDPATLSTGFLVRGLAVALVGGLTSLPGAVIGGLLVGVAEAMSQLITNNQQGVPETLLFVVIVAVLAFRPGGLFGQREETEDKVAFVPALKDLPARLKGTSAAKGIRIIGYVISAVILSIGVFTSPKTTTILTEVVLIGLVGVSLTVLMGYAGQISLGHWGLAGVGAFALGNMFQRMHIPFVLSLPLVVVVGMALSLLIGLPALRIRGLYLAVVTLGFNLAAEFFIFRHKLIGNGTAGIIIQPPKLGPFDLDAPSQRPLYVLSVICLLLSMIVAANLARSRTGRGFYALRENEKAAATLGVRLTKYKLLSFAVSGGMASLAGALYGMHLGKASYINWSTDRSLVLVAMVLIGGLGSTSGALLGSFLVFGLPRLLEFQNGYIVPIGTGILLILVITRLRGGLAGVVQDIRTRGVAAVDELSAPATPPAPPPAPATPAGG